MLPHTPRPSFGIPPRVLPAPADQRPAVSSPAGRASLAEVGPATSTRFDGSAWRSGPGEKLIFLASADDVEAVLRREPDFAAGFTDEMAVRQRREGQPDGMMAAACAVVAVLFVVAIGCGVFITPAVRQLLGAL